MTVVAIVGVGVGVVVLIIAYVVACRRHPYVLCSQCFDDAVLRAKCPLCGKAGRQLRLGARLTGMSKPAPHRNGPHQSPP